MKQLIFICLISICTCKIYSQPPINGEYLKYDYLDKYQGTWMWTSGSDTVIIKLKKLVDTSNGPVITFYSDDLFGVHKYIQNGVVIENSLPIFDTITYSHTDSNTITGTGRRGSDTSWVKCYLTDITKKKELYLRLSYINNNPPQLKWETFDAIEVLIDDGHLPGFTMPRNIVLTKQ